MFILTLFFILVNINVTNALTFKKVGNVFVNEKKDSPNIATLNDIIFEKPNIATLPDIKDDFIEDEKKENLVIKEPEIKEENKNILLPNTKVKDKKPNKEIKLSKQTIAPKTKVIKAISNDKFSNLNLNEGEEVLVSMSSPKSIEKNISYNTKTKTPKRKLKNKLSKKRLYDPFKNSPVIKDRQIIMTDNKTIKLDSPIFPIAVKQNETPDPEIVKSISNEKRINNIELINKTNKQRKERDRIYYGTTINNNPFIKAFSSLKPEHSDDKIFTKEPGFIKKEKTIANISSDVLKHDLNQTYLADNKYLSPLETPDDEEGEDDEDTEDDKTESKKESTSTDNSGDSELSSEKKEEPEDISAAVKLSEKNEAKKDSDIREKTLKDIIDVNKIKNQMSKTKNNSLISGSLKIGNRKILQMKIDFEKSSSAISGESVNLLRSFAQIVTDRPTDSIEITIPSNVMNNVNKKKLAARRLSLISNILRETGISDRQIKPVLSNRDEDSFTFRVISNDKNSKLKIGSKGIFDDEDNTKEYDIMKW